jgi:hypothetical protein
MRVRRPFFLALYFCFFASALPAQLPPVKPDPLHPTQTIQGSGACSVTKPSSCAQAAAKITPIVMGDSPLEANLRHLSDDIGGRVTGSPEMSKAVDWAIAAFRAGGVDVRTEKYTLPHAWSEGATKLDVLGPVSFPVSLVSVGLSPATPDGGIEAPLVFIGNGTEADFLRAGASLKGAILLVHMEVSYTWEDLLREYDIPPSIIDRAAKAGAAAILWTGERERKLLYRHQFARWTPRSASSGHSCARGRLAHGTHRARVSGQDKVTTHHAQSHHWPCGTAKCRRRNSRLRKA